MSNLLVFIGCGIFFFGSLLAIAIDELRNNELYAKIVIYGGLGLALISIPLKIIIFFATGE